MAMRWYCWQSLIPHLVSLFCGPADLQ
jgi:hypothetical protein